MTRLITITIIFLALLPSTFSCSSPETVETGLPEGTPWADYGPYGQYMELTLYYRNNSYLPHSREQERVLPATRSVWRTEAAAGAVFRELLSGPRADESQSSNLGPVINAKAVLDDIYVVDGICVVHLVCAEPLPLPGGRSVLEDELVMVESLVRSLTAVDYIDAVWLFQNGSPWKGHTVGWCSPLAPEGEPFLYKLYLPWAAGKFPEMFSIDESIHEAFPLVIRSPVGTTPENCPLILIIKKLTGTDDSGDSGMLQPDNRNISITLKDGLFRLDLPGDMTALKENTSEIFKALVYTLTGMPEIRRVMITIDGQYWHDGSKVWDFPLERSDFR